MPLEATTVAQTTRSATNRVHEFDPTQYDWDDWEVLFETYINVEGVTDDTKKRNLLITALAVQPFKTLISVCKPKKPNEYQYSELVTKLRSNYKRVTFPSTERVRFFAKRQEPTQSLTDFANSLRDKAATCSFPSDFYEDALIATFVGGLRNEHVRKHLMQKDLKTFEQTINSAKTIESVFIEGSNGTDRSSGELSMQKIQHRSKPPSTSTSDSKSTCHSCGATDHLREKCRFRNSTCHSCSKKGHISKVCRSKGSQSKTNVNTISSSLQLISQYHPIKVVVQLEDTAVDMELDTGSPVTIINTNIWKKIGSPTLQSVTTKLSSFTGHPINIKGEATVRVNYDSQKSLLPLLVVNGHHNNILGRDWLEALHINKMTLDEIVSNNTVCNINRDGNKLNVVLNQFQNIFNDGLGCCSVKAHLHIKPNAIPKFCKARPLPFAFREAVEKDLDRLVTEGVLEPVNISKWAAPIVVVPKPGGRIRLCADFSTGLNQALDINQYPLPRPAELFIALNGGTQFSKIDLSDAYLQVALDEESKELLVINTHKGLFRFNRLPFGIASAPSIFQQIMDQMLAGLDNTVCYLDDIIVTGKDPDKHLKNLQKVLQRISEYGFHINKTKCSFLQDSIEYLGFIVDKHGVHTSPSKTKAIIDMPKPTNVSQLRSFLGMVNHYGKFVSKLTDRLAPFFPLLQKDHQWNWTLECDQAFANIKQILVSPLILVHYDPTLPLVLAADASNSGVGAVIYHRYPDGTEKTIAHASKTLTRTEQQYAQIEKEALALIYGTHKFDQFLRGREFTLLTDHKPLVTIFGSKKGIPTTSANRLQRWAIRLMGYRYQIEYRSTDNFGQADGLSRLPIGPDNEFDTTDPSENQVMASIQEEMLNDLPIRSSEIAKATRSDSILKQVHHFILSGWPPHCADELRPYFRIRDELSTAHGCVVWGFRTVVPPCFRDRLLLHLHSVHSGMGRMKGEARRYFWWPSLDKDIEDIARQCQACTEFSKQPAKTPLQQWNVPHQPWQRIHIDFMGKFFGHHFLVIVDAHSKWLEVFIMNNISSAETIRTLTTLFARYGLCEEIISDNGTQFTSDEFAQFCARHGIRHLRSAPGHPQSNGQAERYVDTVKNALKKGIDDGGKVSDVLCKFLFRYRSTPHSTTNATPAELFLKRQLRTVLDLLRPTAADASSNNRKRYRSNFDCHTKQQFFVSGDKVLVRDFRHSKTEVKWTPGILLDKFGSRIWSVTVGTNIWRRHENQIKRRYWSSDDDIVPVNPSISLPSKDTQSTTTPLNNKDPAPIRPVRQCKAPQRLIEEI